MKICYDNTQMPAGQGGIPIDAERFHNLCEKITQSERMNMGIGTLGEKTIHSVLKYYFEPDESYHEKKINSFYADISGREGIFEVQTAHFDKLRKKLECFLAAEVVTIVYPVPYRKWLRWIDEQTGEVSPPRKSPKLGTPYEVFNELYKIKHYLLHPNLRLRIMLLDVEEYRYLNGWSKDKKKGSSRAERLPLSLEGEIAVDSPDDYLLFIPDSLPEQFTSKDYKKAAGLPLNRAQTALLLLYYVGALERTGKKGNAFLYERKK